MICLACIPGVHQALVCGSTIELWPMLHALLLPIHKVPLQYIGRVRHSCLVYSHLRVIQPNPGLPQHCFIQDEPTRWNSLLYMQQWILEQKVAFAAYATKHLIVQLHTN